jgi:hypothetical protein
MSRRQDPWYLTCRQCGGPMPPARRAHAQYCRAACRVHACKIRRLQAATGSESVSPATQDGRAIPAGPA